MAKKYRVNESATYGSLAYDLDALVLERQLEEAGTIDGARSPGIFFRIMVPNAVTMIVTVILFSIPLHPMNHTKKDSMSLSLMLRM